MMKVVPDSGIHDRFIPCMEAGAVMAATMVRDSVVVLHQSPGCYLSSTHWRSNNVPDGSYVKLLTTGVQQNDLIHGGTAKLRKHVREAAEEIGRSGKAKLIWILSSCSTSMVQDDLEGVAREVERDYGIKTVAVDTPGFQGGLAIGLDAIYNALMQNYADKSVQPEKGKINLLGTHLMGTRNMIDDVPEIQRLLEAAGIQVNVTATFNSKTEDFVAFRAAEANYVLSPEVLPKVEDWCAAQGMEIWGRDVVLPVGLANTEEWYLAVAARFGDVDKAKRQLREDMARVKKRIGIDYNASWVMQDVAGKRVGLVGYAPFVAAMARCMFFDFNARPVVVGLWGESPRAIETAKKQLEVMSPYLDFEVLENPSYHEYATALQREKVDFAIGQINDRPLVEGLGIPNLTLGGFYFFNHWTFMPWPFFGVRGILHLLTELGKVMLDLHIDKESWKARSLIRPPERPAVGTCGDRLA